MPEPLNLDALAADAQAVKFCPHMDWQTNRCSACRHYRMAKAVEGLIAELRDTRAKHYEAEQGWYDCTLRAEQAEAERHRLMLGDNK